VPSGHGTIWLLAAKAGQVPCRIELTCRKKSPLGPQVSGPANLAETSASDINSPANGSCVEIRGVGEPLCLGFLRCLHLGAISELSLDAQRPLFGQSWPKKESTLENGNQLMSGLMSEHGKKFSTTMIKFRVMHPARSRSPKLGIPACPQPFLASSRHSSTGFPADPEALARHPGNMSQQTLRHLPGTPAEHSGTHSDISRHCGNISWHMLGHYPGTLATRHGRH
jgi:hypothetical protein